jgi:glutamate N-acetyltransferase/amino-acid N-acetyltransferase
VAEYLAKCIAKDGEGATKIIEVEVQNAVSFGEARKVAKAVVNSPLQNAVSFGEARKVAKAVVNSPLVKTAIFGKDPNWGRILAAVGYSGAEIEPDKVDLYLKEKIVEDGQPLKFSRQKLHEYLESSDEVKIIIDLKMGKVNGCDLTYDYVKINTKYN